MLRHSNPKLNGSRLCERIRRRSEAASPPPAWEGETSWRESLQGRVVELGASQQRASRPVADYADLLGLPDADFLDAAYRYLLGRLPGIEERNCDLERLMEGLPRERLLLTLAERAGRHEASLPGLARGLFRARLMYLPKLGRGVRWLLGVLRLDQLRERLEHNARLQDARYQALLELLREQAVRLERLEHHQRRLEIDNEVLHQMLTERPDEGGAAPASSTPPREDAAGRDFYRALEARFRGDPSTIAALMREHLPEVQAAAPLGNGLPLLDLGCGRGEWLALLREERISARGVDLNLANIKAGREQGLDVEYQDALTALRGCADASLGMITAFHLVEHLPHDQLRELLHEAYRALAPGGRLLMETPNPQNLIVGSCNFYLDPTHVRPLPPDFLVFLAEFAGFEGVEARPLHPVGEEHRLKEESETALRLNHYLYGPQDYALLAERPVDTESQPAGRRQEQDP